MSSFELLMFALLAVCIVIAERVCWKGETELPLTLVEYKLLCQRIDSEETGDWYGCLHCDSACLFR